ncbi:MAG: S8 family serine peptidase [candidate division Zixibacteria bacterium]|nr:S8 family serine peptidase [candidate division Zixibacteria bacterium]
MWFSILLLVGLDALPAAAALGARQQAILSPSLIESFATATADTLYDALISLASDQQVPSQIASSSVRLASRHTQVGNFLRAAAAGDQDHLTAALSRLPAGSATIVRRFWITNAVQIRADRAALLALAERSDVQRITEDFPVELFQPVSIADAVATATGAQANLQTVGVRALWAKGLTGQGRLVASIDTGVESAHPALHDRWRGVHGDTAASLFDPLGSTVPIDNNGHGTHVMGIMVGRDGADTIGLAPDAEWINASVVDRGRSLSATFADILAALQWVADPDGDPATTNDVPDVVCNSWGVSQTIINPCDDIFFDAIDHVESMGVVCVFAAGNEGPFSMSIRNPADRATSPTASFSVGAVDATSADLPIPGFSSRGPSACDGHSIKPELAAPGVSIRSSYKGQTYKQISGTSMAAPHVAAGVALLRQYNPDLTPEEIKTALISTARDIDTPGEDNASGHGMLDLEAALAAVAGNAPRPRIKVAATSLDPDGDGILSVGETVPFLIALSVSEANAPDVIGVLASLTPGVVVATDSAYYGTIPAGQTVENRGAPFVVSVTQAMRAGDSARFVLTLSGDALLSDWADTIIVPCALSAQTLTPRDFQLGQNYPNPFNAATTIPLSIVSSTSSVRLDIIDILGRHVRVLVDEAIPAGQHTFSWDATDDHGHTVASGIYFSRLSTASHAGEIRQMVLLK